MSYSDIFKLLVAQHGAPVIRKACGLTADELKSILNGEKMILSDEAVEALKGFGWRIVFKRRCSTWEQKFAKKAREGVLNAW